MQGLACPRCFAQLNESRCNSCAVNYSQLGDIFWLWPDPVNALLDWRNRFGGTPLGACVHGALYGWRKDTDFPGTAEALVRAGSRYTAEALPTGHDAIDEVLRRHLKDA